MPKPAKLPAWATEDKKDPITGQWNVVDPPDEKKEVGWLIERPVRNYMNWLFRTIHDWIKYFDDNLDLESALFTPIWTGIDPLTITSNKGFFDRDGDLCNFAIETIWSGNLTVDAMSITNMPFASKNIIDFNQIVEVSRGRGPTIPGGAVPLELYALIQPGTTTLELRGEDLFTGLGSQIGGGLPPGDAFSAGSIGQLIITGSYYVEV